MKPILQSMVLLAVMLLPPLAVSADESGAMVEDAAVAVATVVAIDEKTRNLTLKGPEGDEWTFTAGPEVRNFAQIKRGDRVMASYFAGFALALGPVSSGIKAKFAALEVSRAKPGDKPAASVTRKIAAVGTVKAIDLDNRTVILQGAERTVELEVAEDVDLSTLKVGDAAEALYVESYAVQVIPAPKVSGTVMLESTSVALGVGVEWGHGTLTLHDGSTHKIKINGLSVVDLGVSKIEATGEVFNLVELTDMDGTFFAGQAGIAVGVGGSATAMKNSNGVVIQLKSTEKGIKLTLAPEGLNIKLAE